MKRTCLIIFAIGVLVTHNASAQNSDYGDVYVGLGAGITHIQASGGGLLDEDELGYQLSIGYRAQNQLAVELAYIDFGKAEKSGQSAELTGWQVAGIYDFNPVAGDRLAFSLGAGWLFSDGDFNDCIVSPCDDFSDEENGPFGIAGARWSFTDRLSARFTGAYYFVDYEDTLHDPYRFGLDLLWKTN